MGAGAVSFVKVAFGIVNPELVRNVLEDRVEGHSKEVRKQREAAAKYERRRAEQAAAARMEEVCRAAVAKRVARTLRLRAEAELCSRIFWSWRGVAAIQYERKRRHAATVINRLCRMQLAGVEAQQRREDARLQLELRRAAAARTIQRVYRGVLGRRRASERRRVRTAAAIHIQRVHRGRAARRRVAALRVVLHGAVTTIAALYRGRRDRMRCAQRRVVRHATRLARVSRLWLARRRLRASLRRRAAVRIQSGFRTWCARRSWLALRGLIWKHRAAIVISKMWRGARYRSLRAQRVKLDAPKIRELALGQGLRRQVTRLGEWGGGLTMDLLLQCYHNNQLGGSFVGRDGEEKTWGVADMAERSRLLDAIQQRRRQRRRRFRRSRSREKASKPWEDAVKARLGPAAFRGSLVAAAAAGDMETVQQLLAVQRAGGEHIFHP
jgi:hypothetical protein